MTLKLVCEMITDLFSYNISDSVKSQSFFFFFNEIVHQALNFGQKNGTKMLQHN